MTDTIQEGRKFKGEKNENILLEPWLQPLCRVTAERNQAGDKRGVSEPGRLLTWMA